MQAIVALDGAQMGIDANVVLSDVDLQVYNGEFCYLTGRSGSGKSTLLKTLYGAIPLMGGKASVADYDLRKLDIDNTPDLRRKIGMVFQDFRLFLNWSVQRNLSYVLEATGWKERDKAMARIDEVLSAVGLADKINDYAYALSGGEQQRLCIARALLNDPQLIIADEPTGHLDVETSDEVFDLFRHVNEQIGTAIIFATHDQRLMSRYPARVIHCKDGRLIS